ncbi:DUF1289 domain-containing protein [Azomonas macrocytogenes]|uniref:Fe-S protein n=1 Tax=Azomonas macrocytogenes TaxID=69962 RepID=A0A839T4Z1_AZOMA|nr:DUF1289 domain-containing protein [Azomonas macrocytogenes]MBB3104512.1 hypothetical protein [Azomonas macrocytogenes]
MLHRSIKTPCNGLCSTVYGDLVCRGCKRFHYEIISWNHYSEKEKQAIWSRLEDLLVQVIASKLEVYDESRLRWQLELQSIRYPADLSAYCWAYQLLVKGSHSTQQLTACGIALLPEFQGLPLSALCNVVDRELLFLSYAYYKRYITPDFLQ